MMLDTFPDRRSAMFKINKHCLGAGISGVIAWTLWPSSPEWWGLGVISVILGMQVPIGLISAVKVYAAFRQRERAIAAYSAQGAPTKSSAMASRKTLIDAGMIDGEA